MNSKVEKIELNGDVYAIIHRSELEVEGAEFYTPPEYPFQIGVQVRDKGYCIKAHVHKPITRTIYLTQEMLHIDYGRVVVIILDEGFSTIAKTTLQSGDTILFARGGHRIEVLERTKIIEVKQGPYYSREADKIFMEKD